MMSFRFELPFRSVTPVRPGRWIWVAAWLMLLGTPAGTAWALGTPSVPLSTLESRYTTPTSRFVDVDGVRMHYKDEGTGPVVVMLHASFMSLHSWDGLAADLARDHRVIRFDFPLAGLTGPDPQGRYSMERSTELMNGLLAKLGVSSYSIIATSSGAIIGFRQAAAKPEAVTRLILINAAGMPRTPVTDPNRERGSAFSRWLQGKYKSREYWQKTLTGQFTAGEPPPADVVERVFDFNRRDRLVEDSGIYMRNFRTGDPETVLGQVRAPTLILWGMGNITVAHLEADVFQLWLTQAPSIKKKYPRYGHYIYMENPAIVIPDVRNFLEGRMDTDLRVTRRMPPSP